MPRRQLVLFVLPVAVALAGTWCTPSERIETSRDVLICVERAAADRLLASMRDAGAD